MENPNAGNSNYPVSGRIFANWDWRKKGFYLVICRTLIARGGYPDFFLGDGLSLMDFL
jgi:hypothetical protein